MWINRKKEYKKRWRKSLISIRANWVNICCETLSLIVIARDFYSTTTTKNIISRIRTLLFQFCMFFCLKSTKLDFANYFLLHFNCIFICKKGFQQELRYNESDFFKVNSSLLPDKKCADWCKINFFLFCLSLFS